MALVGLSLTTSPSLGPGTRIDVATAGVIALCVISTAFTAQAISTGFDRRYAVLRYLGVTPLGRGGLVAAKVLATLAAEVLQIGVIAVLGLVLGWRPETSGIAYAVLFVVVGTWAFVALALLLAGTLRAEAVLAIANLVWVLLLGLGGVIVPRTELPRRRVPRRCLPALRRPGRRPPFGSRGRTAEPARPRCRRRLGTGRHGPRGASLPLRRLNARD